MDEDFVPLMEWQLPFVGRPVSNPIAGQPVHADYQKSTEQQSALSFRPVHSSTLTELCVSRLTLSLGIAANNTWN